MLSKLAGSTGLPASARLEMWRILVGEDAKILDRLVRENPEEAYEPRFMEKLLTETPWGLVA